LNFEKHIFKLNFTANESVKIFKFFC